MTDFCVKLTVPILTGIEIYQHWTLGIRNALRAKSLRLWQVASGEYMPNSRVKVSLTESETHYYSAMHFNVAATDLTNCQVSEWTRMFIDTPNEELYEWEQLNATAFHLIATTLERSIFASIMNEENAYVLMCRLYDLYGPKADSLSARLNAWQTHIYRVGMDPFRFALRFIDLLANVHAYYEDNTKMAPMYVLTQFVAAVRAYGNEMEQWLPSELLDLTSQEDPAFKAILSFLEHKRHRLHFPVVVTTFN